MRKIIRIARLEWSVLFYSPIAWIIWILIFLQCGLNYTDTLYQQETQQQLERPLVVVSRVLFAGEKGMISSLIEYLYLFIPILTMGIFSREFTSGSFKLLQSSPVTPWQIVLGKFLSIVWYAALVVGSLAVFLFSAYVSVEQFDIGFVVFGLVGVFLLICTYASVGLFMSSLTPYQVVAAISTLALLAFFNYAPLLGSAYDSLRDLTYWLSIGGRTEDLVNGLLVSRDMIYFILIIFFFLLLTVLHMQFKRKAVKLSLRIASFVGVFAGLLFLGYLSSRPVVNFYYDTTRINDRTLSVTGQEISKTIKDPIKIVSFTNVLDHKAPYGAPKNRIGDQSRFEQFQRFIPQMEYQYIAYYDSIPYLRLDSGETMVDKARKSAEALGFNFKKLKTPEMMRAYPELTLENNSFVRYIEYQGKSTPLRMYDDLIQYPSEGEILAALLRLTEGPSVIGLVQGQGERGITQYSDNAYTIFLNGNTVRGSVVNQGFEVNELNIGDLYDFQGDVVIIADPQNAYSSEELQTIFNYIDRGGNLFLLADPDRNNFVTPIMKHLGLSFKPGTLLQKSESFDPDLLQLEITPKASEKGYRFYEGAHVIMTGASGIVVDPKSDFEITPVLVTTGRTMWNRTEAYDLSKQKISFDPEKDQGIEIPTALVLERSVGRANQKIFVAGDADFMSNTEMNRYNLKNVNSSFAMRIFKWFSGGKYPVSTPKDKNQDTQIRVDRKHINMQKGILLGLIPFVLIVAGVITLNRRKGK